jgi:WYL domain
VPVPSRNSFDVRELPAKYLSSYIKARIRDLKPTTEVELLVHAPVEKVSVVLGRWAMVSAGSGRGSSRVLMTVESFDWPMMTLASIEADFTVISPPEFRDYLARFAERITKSS